MSTYQLRKAEWSLVGKQQGTMEAAGRTDHENGKGAEDRSLLILYGTETGHSQEIAYEIGDAAERLRFRTTVEQMNDVSLVRDAM